jgi:hypothetical protein
MESIAKLKPKSKEVFDKYIELRSLWKVSQVLGIHPSEVYGFYNTIIFQTALKEYNEALLDKVSYNSAVIIDELWKLYNDDSTGNKSKIDILAMLGKHIGMWATQTKDNSKPNIQYNIINYEIDKHKDEVEKVINTLQPIADDTPLGFEVISYNE